MRRTIASPVLTRTRAVTAVLALATMVVACSGAQDDASDPPADSSAAAAPAAEASAAQGGAVQGKIHLEVIGGPSAGVYDVDMKDGGCSYGLAGPTAWGNQYSIDTKDPKAFSSLQMVVPDTKAAANGTSVFQLTAQFGPLFGNGGASYDVNTRPDVGTKSGSGQVTVEDHGSTGRVNFDAKTDDGVELKGTIDCL
ncbi:MAG TPA: hypothetical protein VFL93_10545, partial [Longimicrobiaceae bacterium]|nr:hypothetical protein [Longimicrobiaceae bacterium]